MSAEPRVALTRKQETTVRRLEGWMEPLSAAGLSEADGPAYRALVDALLGAMVAVGPADAMQGIAALTKTLALMLASTLRLEDDAKVSETCLGQAAWIENEVITLRQAMKSSAKKEN